MKLHHLIFDFFINLFTCFKKYGYIINNCLSRYIYRIICYNICYTSFLLS
nr:MAG TPA: hypothetical protein [Caudoviricetes sp.]